MVRVTQLLMAIAPLIARARMPRFTTLSGLTITSQSGCQLLLLLQMIKPTLMEAVIKPTQTQVTKPTTTPVIKPTTTPVTKLTTTLGIKPTQTLMMAVTKPTTTQMIKPHQPLHLHQLRHLSKVILFLRAWRQLALYALKSLTVKSVPSATRATSMAKMHPPQCTGARIPTSTDMATYALTTKTAQSVRPAPIQSATRATRWPTPTRCDRRELRAALSHSHTSMDMPISGLRPAQTTLPDFAIIIAAVLASSHGCIQITKARKENGGLLVLCAAANDEKVL